jgi:hypothetical protein
VRTLLHRALSELKTDLPVAEFLKTHFPNRQYAELRDAIKRMVEGYDAADPDRASTFALRDEWTVRESCKSIDVRRWHREGRLSAGQYFTSSWKHSGGEPTGSINVRTERDGAILTYQTRHGPANEWKPINQRIPITWTDCHFGGRRPWFICPIYTDGRYCGRRVAVLYGLRDYFACRHCYRLAYESQQEPIRMRGLLKAQKILLRLGAKPDLLDPFPEKPPRMHRRTYQRLHRAYETARTRCIQGIMKQRAP